MTERQQLPDVHLRNGQVRDEDERQLSQLFAEVCNWDRWGPDDERGTLNYVSPDKTRQAAALVQHGVVIPAGHAIDTERSRKNREPAVLEIHSPSEDEIAVTDTLALSVHSVTVTHLDALAHVFFGDHVYNARTVKTALSIERLRFGSVLALSGGTVTRGVLLDIARARGVPYLDTSCTITAADLDAAESLAGCRVERGDAVLVRSGLEAREAAQGPEDPRHRAGLAVECVRWFHERQISIYAGDCFDKLPSPYVGLTHPFHAIALAAMGLAMIDNVRLAEVARQCDETGSSCFMFVLAPLRIPGGTGSAVNPLCVF